MKGQYKWYVTYASLSWKCCVQTSLQVMLIECVHHIWWSVVLLSEECAAWPSVYIMLSLYKANIYSGPDCTFFGQPHYTSPHKIYKYYQHYLKYDRCTVTVGLGLKLGDVRLYICSPLSCYRYASFSHKWWELVKLGC